MRNKIGFLHIPRTGGTHLERLLNEMGPEKFINFFGHGAAKNQAINGIPVIETMKKGDNKNKQLLNNPNYKTCELFSGHFSHNIEECFDEDVEFITILRDPIQRITSMAKRFLTSEKYKNLLMLGAEKIGDDIFWKNLEDYLNTKSTIGLLTHEVHGFSNYMTKVIAGCDISNPNINVNDEIFEKAITNLKKMKYVGFFEEYNKAIDDILTMFNLDVNYDCGPLKISKIPETTKKLFTELNKYDIKLYNFAKELKKSEIPKITYVTALLDINRKDLENKNFKRDFSFYLKHVKKLLENLKDENLVIYCEEKYFDYIKEIKSNQIILKSISIKDIQNTEYYEKIQKIRLDPEWYNQVGWLSNSVQAKLELYNPLIFQKIHILDDISQNNPFDDDYFVWVDAGISNAQGDPSMFRTNWYKEKIRKELDKFLFISFPYKNYSEIHGFKKEGLKKYYDGEIEKVTRATFFGGRQSYIHFLSERFKELANKTLDDGYLGTEESIFTLLVHLYPNKINSRMTHGGGLVRGYFDSLKNDKIISNESPQKNYKPKPYKGIRNQQNPNTFKVFKEFFEKHDDFDLIIEIGSGFGGFTLFLFEESQKINARFISIEKNKKSCDNIKNNINENIDVRNEDVFDLLNYGGIENEIDKSKRTLILCDGGDLAKEFNEFAKIIKKDDVIMAHDYVSNRKEFKLHYKGKIWDHLELSDSDIEETVKEQKLINYYDKFNDVVWVCKKKNTDKKYIKKPRLNEIKTNLYILTFNFPEQVIHTLKSMEKTPELLKKPNLFLLDNSTIDNSKVENKKICEEYNMEYIDLGKNTGICGGRQAAAEHFHESNADYMLFFEDDMTFNGPEFEGKFCRNGFRKYVPNLYEIVHKIMIKNEFDFLKFSFTEVYFDNDKQCSWYNVPQEIRTRDWPHYDKLPTKGLDPNVPLTNFKNIRVINGLSYIDGEIYYANWPQIVSKSGNQKMFINTKWAHPYEQTWMSHIYKETKKGNIKPAVLLASPILHDRIKHYKPEERREN